MAIERKFIADNYRKLEVKEFLEKGLDRAGCGEIDIQRTPLGTRIIIHAQRPGLVIGRKGSSIRKSTTILKTKYKIDNPQIEVSELEIPELNAKIMAKSVASAMERGIHFRRAAYTSLRRIMEAGARGAEIVVSGKLTGDRSKTVKFIDGCMKHCGEPALIYVDRGQARASPKPGVIGVTVKIMPPGVRLPDEIEFLDREKVEAEKTVQDAKEDIAVVDEDKTIKPEKVKKEASEKKVVEKKPAATPKAKAVKKKAALKPKKVEKKAAKKTKAPKKAVTEPEDDKAVKKKAAPKPKKVEKKAAKKPAATPKL